MTDPSTTSAQATNSSWFHALARHRSRVCVLLAALCISAVAISILAIRNGASNATAVPRADMLAARPASPQALEAARAAATLQQGQHIAETDAQVRDAETRAFRDHCQNDGTRVADPDRP